MNLCYNVCKGRALHAQAGESPRSSGAMCPEIVCRKEGGVKVRKTEAYRAVEAVVRSLGVTCANISMRQFIHGVELVYLDPDLLDHVTKKLYPRIAELYPDANGKSVERNLRSARDAIIERADPAHLEKILGYPLRYSLSVGNLLDAICYYLERNGLWPEE